MTVAIAEDTTTSVTLWAGTGCNSMYLVLARADWERFARVFVLEQRALRRLAGTV